MNTSTSPEFETKVHTLGDDEHCLKCGSFIGHDVRPSPHKPVWRLGEFVAVITYGGQYRSSYRIGENNQQLTCDGIPAAEFHQD